MNFLKRALISTRVKLGRTCLLTLVFSAILIFILAGLIIQNASMKAIENAQSEAGATVTLSVNRDFAFGKMEPPSEEGDSSEERGKGFSFTPVDLTVATKLAGLEQVDSYNYISSTSANASSFEAITSSSTESDSGSSVMFG